MTEEEVPLKAQVLELSVQLETQRGEQQQLERALKITRVIASLALLATIAMFVAMRWLPVSMQSLQVQHLEVRSGAKKEVASVVLDAADNGHEASMQVRYGEDEALFDQCRHGLCSRIVVGHRSVQHQSTP